MIGSGTDEQQHNRTSDISFVVVDEPMEGAHPPLWSCS